MSGGHPIDSTGQQEPTVGPSTPSGISGHLTPRMREDLARQQAHSITVMASIAVITGHAVGCSCWHCERLSYLDLPTWIETAKADLAKYRGVQEAVKSALLMGAQTADIRCRAALAALVNPEGGER